MIVQLDFDPNAIARLPPDGGKKNRLLIEIKRSMVFVNILFTVRAHDCVTTSSHMEFFLLQSNSGQPTWSILYLLLRQRQMCVASNSTRRVDITLHLALQVLILTHPCPTVYFKLNAALNIQLK